MWRSAKQAWQFVHNLGERTHKNMKGKKRPKNLRDFGQLEDFDCEYLRNGLRYRKSEKQVITTVLRLTKKTWRTLVR